MKYLYKNFLENKKVYNLNEAFYKKMFESTTDTKAVHFFNRKYKNGKKMYDEHIFSSKIGNRIIQIIQQDPDSEHSDISAWMEKWDEKEDLLIVNLKLSSEIKDTLKMIFKQWFVEKTPVSSMKNLIEKLPA